MTAVYLTTYLPARPLRDRPIRRRRKIAEGEKLRIRLAPLSTVAPEMSDEEGDEVQTLFVDGKPVVFVNPFSSEWVTTAEVGDWWGNGIDFVPVAP